jgi:hypothetical protein
MNKLIQINATAVTLALALAVGLARPVTAQEKVRNPFNVEDVPDPDGADVKAFAAQVKAPTDSNDPNAASWAEKKTAGKSGSLDGEWSSRWNGGGARGDWIVGTASVKAVGDRVYILYQDRTNRYLIDTLREGKNRLVGRYMNLGVKRDSTPWVGFLINDDRIDGFWAQGRWDLRRSLVEPSVKNGSSTPTRETSEIVVTSAIFGIGIYAADVTKRVAHLMISEPEGFNVRPDWLHADPLPNKRKALVIAYDYNGKHCLFVVPELARVSYDLLVQYAKHDLSPPE